MPVRPVIKRYHFILYFDYDSFSQPGFADALAGKHCFEIVSPMRTVCLRANSQIEMQEWYAACFSFPMPVPVPPASTSASAPHYSSGSLRSPASSPRSSFPPLRPPSARPK